MRKNLGSKGREVGDADRDADPRSLRRLRRADRLLQGASTTTTSATGRSPSNARCSTRTGSGRRPQGQARNRTRNCGTPRTCLSPTAAHRRGAGKGDASRRTSTPRSPARPRRLDRWKKTKVGYEIPFTRHFYKYVPPRPLAEIDADLRSRSPRSSLVAGGRRVTAMELSERPQITTWLGVGPRLGSRRGARAPDRGTTHNDILCVRVDASPAIGSA